MALNDLTQFLNQNFHLPKPLSELDSQDIKGIAANVLRLSDHYIADVSKQTAGTPWKEAWAQKAYAYYFLPLNLVRLDKVIERGSEIGFFNGLNRFVDFGCGPGTAAVLLQQLQSWNQMALTDVSATPVENLNPQWSKYFTKDFDASDLQTKSSLAVFSYVFNELGTLPDWAFDCEAIMIVEPSTSQQARRLMEFRKTLLAEGFNLWAPCTHHLECPLLKNSPTDWCHDSVEFQRPPWFLQIENHLPMKNEKLTFSYLLARKSKPPENHQGRIVGDLLVEKGKRRQMLCQSDERLFLSWMDRDWPSKTWVGFDRGTLLPEIPQNDRKSNELRVKPQ